MKKTVRVCALLLLLLFLSHSTFSQSVPTPEVEAAYLKGRTLLELTQYESALDSLYHAATLGGSESDFFVPSLFYACRAYMALEKFAQAIPLLEYLITRPDLDDRFFTAAGMLFSCYEAQKDYAALQMFGKKIDLAAFPPELQDEFVPRDVLYRAEISFVTEKNPQKSLTLLTENLFASGKYRAWFLVSCAKYSALSGKFAETIDFAQRAQDFLKTPQNPDAAFLQNTALYWQMFALYNLKDYPAVISLSTANPATNSAHDTARIIARSFAAQNEYSRAIPLFEKIYQKTSLAADGINLSSAYVRDGKNAESYKLASAITGQEAAYIAGIAAYNLRNWNAAVQSFSVVNSGERLPYARYYSAVSLRHLERFTEAAYAFSAFLKDFSRSPLYWNAAFNGALSALQAGKDALALSLAETAWKTAIPQEAKIQSALVLAGMYADSGKTAQAVALLKPLSQGDTLPALQCLFALGDLYAKTGDLTAADESWRLLVQKNSSLPLAEDAAFRRAELFYDAGSRDKTLERLALYRKNYPKGRYADSALYLTASVLYDDGTTDQALLLWQELLSKYPTSTYTYNTLKMLTAAYRAKGEYAQALRTTDELLRTFGAQARSDGIDRTADELRLLASGVDKKAALLLAAYERSGKDTTEDGRALAPELASYYFVIPNRRAEGIAMLTVVLEKAAARLSFERDTAARAAFMLGNAYREDGNVTKAASLLLTAAEYSAPLDRERTAQALYGAAESFDRAGALAEVRSTVETLKKTAPDSVWTQRAAALIGGNP